MKRKGPHANARYRQVAEAYKRVNGDIAALAAEFNLSRDRLSADLHLARKYGLVPQVTQDTVRWVTETAKISDLTVGQRSDLLNALGIDLVKRLVAECPPGVPLMVYIAAIVKDACADDAV